METEQKIPDDLIFKIVGPVMAMKLDKTLREMARSCEKAAVKIQRWVRRNRAFNRSEFFSALTGYIMPENLLFWNPRDYYALHRAIREFRDSRYMRNLMIRHFMTGYSEWRVVRMPLFAVCKETYKFKLFFPQTPEICSAWEVLRKKCIEENRQAKHAEAREFLRIFTLDALLNIFHELFIEEMQYGYEG